MSDKYHPRPGLLKAVRAGQKANAKQKKKNDKLRFLSRYDALTALPNRAFFRSKLGKALRAAPASNQLLTVLFLSLDPYSKINETLGPAMGDRLARCVARRLKEVVGKNDAVGYWGSGEFVLLLEQGGDETQVAKTVADLKKKVERRFFSFKQEFYLTSSIGIALYPLHGLTVETLLKNAGAALFEARECGGNSCRFYSDDLNVRSLKRFALENRLGRGLQRREFKLHYQPQVDTGSWRITGAEALIRWDHPELGSIPPSDFIPFAEKSGLIVPIGEWVLRSACLQLKKWHAQGFRKLTLAINVSARQFQEPESADMIVRILEETRLDPSCLELELTESLLMANAEHVIRSLVKLKDIGVKLALDDFGTGFSSLEYLRRLPLDILKIDQSFVRDASSHGTALISSIISLAEKLRLRVIAEGVETKEQLTFLRKLGCDNMQGYFFGRPIPGEEFKGMLAGHDYQASRGHDNARRVAAS
jgi:diguanylate cyclase (GGDEF)-like protein